MVEVPDRVPGADGAVAPGLDRPVHPEMTFVAQIDPLAEVGLEQLTGFRRSPERVEPAVAGVAGGERAVEDSVPRLPAIEDVLGFADPQRELRGIVREQR